MTNPTPTLDGPCRCFTGHEIPHTGHCCHLMRAAWADNGHLAHVYNPDSAGCHLDIWTQLLERHPEAFSRLGVLRGEYTWRDANPWLHEIADDLYGPPTPEQITPLPRPTPPRSRPGAALSDEHTQQTPEPAPTPARPTEAPTLPFEREA